MSVSPVWSSIVSHENWRMCWLYSSAKGLNREGMNYWDVNDRSACHLKAMIAWQEWEDLDAVKSKRRGDGGEPTSSILVFQLFFDDLEVIACSWAPLYNLARFKVDTHTRLEQHWECDIKPWCHDKGVLKDRGARHEFPMADFNTSLRASPRLGWAPWSTTHSDMVWCCFILGHCLWLLDIITLGSDSSAT